MSEPEIGEVLDLPQDGALPEESRQNIRQVLRLLAEQVRFVSRSSNVSVFSDVAA